MKRSASYRRLKEILTDRRDGLRRVLRRDLNELRSGVGIDIGDTVDTAVDDEFDLVSSQLAQCESRELEQIEDALKRMKVGTYGVCESCDQPIPAARLQALPYAKRCVQCQRASEDGKEIAGTATDWSSVRDELDDEPYIPFAEHVIDVH